MTRPGVSPTMKRLGVVLVLGAIAGVIWFWQRSSPAPRAQASTTAPKAESPASPTDPAAPPPVAPQRLTQVTKLDTEQRRQLADRIATAQAARSATRAPARPQLPDLPEQELAITKTELRAAMRELLPHLRECYTAALPTLASPNFEFTAKLMLSGDPDVGTLIDADAIIDKSTGQPLPQGFDDCVRSTFMVMALPPLAEGSKIEVHYPFKFATN